jgi:hypothetical protein
MVANCATTHPPNHVVPVVPQARPRRHADGLRESHRAGLRALRQGPGRGPEGGTDHAARPGPAGRAGDGRAVRGAVRARHAGARRRGARLVLAAPALGQLRHAVPRLAHLARPGRGHQALVPPPPAADRRHRPGAGSGGRRGHAAHHREPPARRGLPRVLPGDQPALHARLHVLGHRLAHFAAHATFPFAAPPHRDAYAPMFTPDVHFDAPRRASASTSATSPCPCSATSARCAPCSSARCR